MITLKKKLLTNCKYDHGKKFYISIFLDYLSTAIASPVKY